MSKKLVIRITPTNDVLPTDREGIMNYLMRFQTEEQKYLFASYTQFAHQQGWIEDYEGGTRLDVDTGTNTAVVTIVEKNDLRAFYDYMVEKNYFTGLQDYFRDNPEEGTITFEIIEY